MDKLKDINELKELFQGLLLIVNKYGDNNLNHSRTSIMSIIDIIVNTDISNSEEQFIQIQRHYKSLFVAKGPLSEFFIWDEDFNERIKLNKPLSEIRHRLVEILQ